jgi:dynein heavy chain, axonemal
LIDKDEHAKDIFKPNNKGLLHCLSTVLLQEIERYNKLLMKMTSSLVLLSKAIKGLVIMSPELDLMSSALLKNQVPPNWQVVAYPSLKPLASWVRDLKDRVEFMRGWLKCGHPPCYWLSGFFFPHGFMTGTLQTYARKHLKPIDQLGYRFRILKEYLPEKITKAPRDGIYVYGLFIEGAHWSSDWKFLDEQAPGEMTSAMPAIHFLPRVLPDKEKLQ